jgi:hypothetical protein
MGMAIYERMLTIATAQRETSLRILPELPSP